MKEIIIGLASIAFLALVFYVKPNVVNPMDIDPKPRVDNSSNINKTNIPNPANKIHTVAPHKHSISQVHSELSEGLRNDLIQRLKDNTKSSDLEVITLPDGSKMSNLQGRFKHVPVAIKNPDGSTTIKEFYTPP